MVSRARGLTMMVKDSALNLPEGKPIDVTLKLGNKPFTGVTAQVLGNNEIGIFPEHGAALALALGDGASAHFEAPKIETIDFPSSLASCLGFAPAHGAGASASSRPRWPKSIKD